MTASQQSWYGTGLRFCGSCLVTLAFWSAWLVLGVGLAVLVYVAVARELTVPGFVLRRVEANLAKANLTIKFGGARLDPTGKLLLEDVALRSPLFEDPLLTSRRIYVRRSIWSILAGRPIPDEIHLEGATLQLPAILSPSGTAEPLVQNLVVVLRHDENLWHVDQLAGNCGPLAITAHGDLHPPARGVGAPQMTADEIINRFLQAGRRLVLTVNQFTAFEEPTLAVRFESPDGIGNLATFLFTALGANHPWAQPLVLGPLAAGGAVRLDGTGPHVVRLHTAIRRATVGETSQAENIRAVLSAQVDPETFSGRPVDALVAIGSVTTNEGALRGPVLRVELASWSAEQKVHATVAAQIDGEGLAVEVDANLREKSALIRGSGRVTAETIARVLEQHTPRAAPYFVFHDPVTFTAEARLGAGWQFDRLASRVASGRLDSHGVKITAARGRIDIVGNSFLAHDARVTLEDNFAQGSYWMDFGTTDYRMLLTGRLRPPAINGWFHGDWWLNFWDEHFAFPLVPPEADVDMQGRWREPARSEYFGRAEARQPVLLGAGFDRADSVIFLRPNFTHALAVSATQGEGRRRLAGSFKRFTDPATRETNRLEFNLDSSLATETYGQMFQGKVDVLLASFRFTQAPQIHVQGAVEGKWPGATPNYLFTGQAAGGLHYYGFPLESVRVAGGVTGADLRLDEIEFVAAGGSGAGRATLNGPADARKLGFDAYVNGADLGRAIRAV